MNRRHLAIIGAAVLAAELILLAFDTGPDLLLVAALVGLLAATVSFATSLIGFVARPVPTPAAPDTSPTFPDLRSTALRQALAPGNGDNRRAERIHEQLAAIVDDELTETYGIDRDADPDAARRVLGDELDSFISDPAAAGSLTPRRLDRVVTLIEQI